MKTPAISVITCTYNRAHLLGNAIESVLQQTFGDFELIVVDDGSTDNTAVVVNSFSDPRIIYHPIQHSGGYLSKVRNAGLYRACGTYVAFLDSDDLWHSKKLETQVTAMQQNPFAGFCFSNVTLTENGKAEKLLYPSEKNFSEHIFEDLLNMRFVIYTSSLMFKKECLAKSGMFDDRPSEGKEKRSDTKLIYWDYDFMLSLAVHFTCLVVNKPLVTITKHPENASREMNLSQLEVYFIVMKKLLTKGFISGHTHRKIVNNLHYSFAVQLQKAGKYSAATSFFLNRLKLDPLHSKSWVRLFLLLPKRLFRL